MSTAAIDMALLDELFEKQNKLDDILFDDAFFSITADEPETESTGQSDQLNSKQTEFNRELTFKNDYSSKTKSKISLALPLVAEISIIVYLIMNFS